MRGMAARSFAALDEVPSLKENYKVVCEARANLIKSAVLVKDGDKLRFAQDYSFNSPSLPGTVVQGRTSNGRVEWKDAKGKTLKAIQQEQVKG